MTSSIYYDPRLGLTKNFLQLQNKLHFAVHEHTAAEIIYERVDKRISHQEAMQKAEREFEIYIEREMKQLESDFDKMVKKLKNNKTLNKSK